MNPADMPAEIRDYCRETGRPIPRSTGEYVQCILQSLAMRYREVLERMEVLTGHRYNGLHMVGGGIQNELLCRYTWAERCGQDRLRQVPSGTCWFNLWRTAHCAIGKREWNSSSGLFRLPGTSLSPTRIGRRFQHYKSIVEQQQIQP